MELLTKQQIADMLHITPRRFDQIRALIGLEPATQTPLRFTLEDFIRKENEHRRSEVGSDD